MSDYMNSLSNIFMLKNARTRLVTAENVYGKKGCGGMAEPGKIQDDVKKMGQRPWLVDNEEIAPYRELGKGWKVRPCINLEPLSETKLMDVDGPCVIQHIWLTTAAENFRDLVLRFYWDASELPSVEVPLGDFFCNGSGWATVNALPINVNHDNGMNCYFPMPFKKHARITIENLRPEIHKHMFYAITYAECDVPEDAAYFHAQFRRAITVPGKDYVILDNVTGRGQYVGTYMLWQQNTNGWWGEGEIKMYLDGDKEYPTICGTGTEDYFGGAWCFGQGTYSAPFMGYPVGVPSYGKAGNRHGLYRFHIMDPVHFEKDIRVEMQALGWKKETRYNQQKDDISSVAFWYQTLPAPAFPKFPSRNELEII